MCRTSRSAGVEVEVPRSRRPKTNPHATPPEVDARIARLRAELTARGLDVFFKAIYGSPPEKAANLQRAVDALNVHPASVLMVGDSQADYQAARSVGTDFYGRGEQFKASGYPWGKDLRELVIYLAHKTGEA